MMSVSMRKWLRKKIWTVFKMIEEIFDFCYNFIINRRIDNFKFV